MGRGIYLCIDGIDCSGKSTLVRNLERHLLPKPEVLSFPSSGPTGSELRQYLYGDLPHRSHRSLLWLFAADCEEQRCPMERVVDGGRLLITDRHPLLPALIYQTGWHSRGDMEALIDLVKPPVPDQLIIVDVPVEVALERERKRSRRRDVVFEDATELRMIQLRVDYLDLADLAVSRGWARQVTVINGDQSEELLLLDVLELLGRSRPSWRPC